MRSKKNIVIVVVFLLIIIGIFVVFIMSFAKDKSDNNYAMNIIERDYSVFSENIVTFNNYRDSIYEKVFTDAYFDVFRQNYISFNEMFENYEEMIDKTTKSSNSLIKYCNGIYYTKSEVNTMCSNFSRDYEVVINSFVKDVKNYNTLIKEYNSYVSENNLSSYKLDVYKTDKKYIDYNKDKKYEGKE